MIDSQCWNHGYLFASLYLSFALALKSTRLMYLCHLRRRCLGHHDRPPEGKCWLRAVWPYEQSSWPELKGGMKVTEFKFRNSMHFCSCGVMDQHLLSPTEISCETFTCACYYTWKKPPFPIVPSSRLPICFVLLPCYLLSWIWY